LSFQIRPFVLRDAERAPDQLLALESPDGNHAVYAFLVTGHRSADGVLRAALDACCDTPGECREVARRDHEVSGLPGRMLVAASDQLALHRLAVPLGDGRCRALRHLVLGATDAARFDRDLLFRSLRITAPATGLRLPEP